MIVELEPEPPDRQPAPVGLWDSRTGGRMSAPEVAPVRSTNVRRSIVTMLTTLVGLSTPLAGQNAVTAGLAYTVGSGWQVEGFDVGLARAVHAGPIAALSLTARLSSFIKQGAINGRAGRVAVCERRWARTPSPPSLRGGQR